ncbi:hypothetical protein J3R82DRAFT_4795 [Butyriboletus roseoflavus]|nr:hypothetical protein J3R82DRAFT_4795 [Butyriboletus roseoflavus]
MIPKSIRRKLWTRHPLVPTCPPTCLQNRLRSLSTHVPDEEASFGSYSVILPEEPLVWGVSHIRPRPVPPSIGRPPYARTLADDKSTSHPSRSGDPQESYLDDNRIRLGSEEETKLRASAKLARKVREFSGTLVRVGMILNV